MHAGVHVHLMQHSLAHGTPDAVFPNNWFSTHSKAEALGDTGGDTMVLYPMKCPNRAAERRPELIKLLNMRDYDRTVDMSKLEAEKRYFEGTGVLVIDRIRGVAYVSISERADREAAQQCVPKLTLPPNVQAHNCVVAHALLGDCASLVSIPVCTLLVESAFSSIGIYIYL